MFPIFGSHCTPFFFDINLKYEILVIFFYVITIYWTFSNAASDADTGAVSIADNDADGDATVNDADDDDADAG